MEVVVLLNRETDVVLRDGSILHVRPASPADEASIRAFLDRLSAWSYRGAPRSDVGALEDVLLRVSAMVEAHPEVAETDLNPVIVRPDGAVIVDARIRIEAS